MATLDEKILDGPNVGYCSDSDEEAHSSAVFRSETPEQDRKFRPPRPSGGVSTGPKGVLADYKQYEEQRSADRRNAELKLIKEAKRFTLEEAGNRSSSSEDEDELDVIRKRRLEQLKSFSRGRIVEIADAEQFLKVVESDKLVFVHIYRDGLDAAGTLNDALLEMAARLDERGVKFYKVKATVLGTSGNFRANALPALQVYEKGNLIGNFVRITDELGEDFSTLQLSKFLENHDIDIDSA